MKYPKIRLDRIFRRTDDGAADTTQTIAELRTEVSALKERVSRLEAAQKPAKQPYRISKTGNHVTDALVDYFNSKGESIESVASRTGLLPVNVENVLSGKHNISKKIAARLAAAYPFRTEFLLRGEGRLRRQDIPSERTIEKHYLSKYPS